MPQPLSVSEIAASLERAFPPAKAAAWDRVGLQVGDPSGPVRTAAVCHEVTEAVARRIEAEPVDLLVAYHPLLFRPTTALVAGADPAGRAFRLARIGVAVLVAHTSFDVARGGAADALAEVLGLCDVVPFGAVWPAESVKVVTFAPAEAADRIISAMAQAGGGRIGGYRHCAFRTTGTGTFEAPSDSSPAVGQAGLRNVVEEVRIEMNAPAAARDRVVAALVACHPYEEPAFDVYERTGDAGFVGRIGRIREPSSLESLGAMVAGRLGGVVRVAGNPEGAIERIAVVPGSGGTLVDEAVCGGADVIVTGDVSHHTARAAVERGTGVIDPGHAATERPGVARLYAALREVVGTAEDLSHLDSDPWRAP